MYTKSIVFTALVALASVQGKDRKFMIKNNCLETVWPGIFNSAAPAVPIAGPLGFALTPGTYKELTVSDRWGGRIWPRTKCKKTEGGFHCETGDCGGTSEVCDPIKTGEPCTLGEWTLATENPSEAGPFVDWYDLSLVDGFSIPMQIVPSTKECKTLTCSVDLMPNCPKELLGGFEKKTCLSSCKTGMAGGQYWNTTDIRDDGQKTIIPGDRNCCLGPFGVPQSCSLDMIDYYHYFKKGCPDAYAHAYDDKTALQTCDSKLQPDYTITFCPDPVEKITPPPTEDPSYAAKEVCVPKGYKLESGGGDVKPTHNCVPVVVKGPDSTNPSETQSTEAPTPTEDRSTDPAAPGPTTTSGVGTGDDAVTTGEGTTADQGTSTEAPVPGGTSTEALVPGGTSTDAIAPGGTSTDAPAPGGTTTDAPVPSGTTTDAPLPAGKTTGAPVPGGTSTDALAPGGTSTDAAAPGGTLTDAPAPGGTSTDAAGSPSSGEPGAGTTSSAAATGTKRPKVSCRERNRKRAALKAKRMLKENEVAHVQL